jgi:predicted nucleic acid-binding protein
MSYLLDTCVISELVRPTPNKQVVQWIDARNELELFLSVLTLGEIQKGITRLPSSIKKTRLTSWLKEELEGRFAKRIIPVSSDVALKWGIMLGTAESNGHSLSAIDALIAATAVVHGLVLVTRNVRDFAECAIDLHNPWYD